MQNTVFSADAALDMASVGHILLASGDRALVAAIGSTLRTAGFMVMEAYDGVAALESCLTNSPSLAVIDNKIIDSDGIQVMQQLAGRAAVPFIFLCASGDQDTISAAVAGGAMAHLVKPFDPAQIIPVVCAALRRSQELRTLQTQTERLSVAVRTGKQIGIATGLIMANLKLDQQEAFERLRRQARARRTRLEDFAAELLRIADEAGGIYRSLETCETQRRLGTGTT